MASIAKVKSGRVEKPKVAKIVRAAAPKRDYVETIYFGGNRNERDRATFLLSNTSACKFSFKGQSYPTSEHAYHAERLRLAAEYAGDVNPQVKAKLLEGMQAVMAIKRSLKEVKKVADSYQQYFPIDFTEAIEGQLGLDTMWEVLLAKFSTDTEVTRRARKCLLDTGDKGLVQIVNGCERWGMSSDLKKGRNELGMMLKRLRDHLRGN